MKNEDPTKPEFNGTYYKVQQQVYGGSSGLCGGVLGELIKVFRPHTTPYFSILRREGWELSITSSCAATTISTLNHQSAGLRFSEEQCSDKSGKIANWDGGRCLNATCMLEGH
ncbi:hypothetical protein CEXT_656081 [Caerostris extrusa]|uniref:Uncharacterized protein n=1 Tax=Caerostris extrusa TaxID=172846 RepID=A0AAV4WYY8_CAEEX|nr:hypothetical protein CEXT_656081 [Caerostris extrusa]